MITLTKTMQTCVVRARAKTWIIIPWYNWGKNEAKCSQLTDAYTKFLSYSINTINWFIFWRSYSNENTAQSNETRTSSFCCQTLKSSLNVLSRDMSEPNTYFCVQTTVTHSAVNSMARHSTYALPDVFDTLLIIKKMCILNTLNWTKANLGDIAMDKSPRLTRGISLWVHTQVMFWGMCLPSSHSSRW